MKVIYKETERVLSSALRGVGNLTEAFEVHTYGILEEARRDVARSAMENERKHAEELAKLKAAQAASNALLAQLAAKAAQSDSEPNKPQDKPAAAAASSDAAEADLSNVSFGV